MVFCVGVMSQLHHGLRHLHDNMGHFGVKRTTDCVKTRFYWPGYEADIAQWVLQCEACQRRNPPVVTPRAPLGTLDASYLFERISWDIMDFLLLRRATGTFW